MKQYLFIFILFLMVSVSHAQRFVRTAKNYAELQNLNPNDTTATNVFVNGYSAVNDGGQGIFSWIWSSVTTADGGTVLPPTTGNWSGRWKRQYDGALNPLWFGASPGGSASSLLSLSNALAASVGQTLRIPRGTFRINGTLLPSNGTTIEGEGSTSVLFIDSQDWGFLLSAKDRVTFRNLKFVGPSVRAIEMESASNVNIENCEFTGFTSLPTLGAPGTCPVFALGVSNLVVQGCKFYGNGFVQSHEQAYYNQTGDIAIGRNGVRLPYNTKIINNDIRESYVNLPMALYDAQNLVVSGNFIDQGNWGTNSLGGYANTGYGILSYVTLATLVTDRVLSTNINVFNNTVTNTAGSGIYIIGADTVNVEGNNLFHTALQQTNFSVRAGGINVSAVRNFSVINNRIAWSSNNGAVFSAGVTNGVVVGNVISDVNLNGFEIGSGETPMSDMSIVDNFVKRATAGFYAVNGTNYYITGNTFSQCPLGLRFEAVSASGYSVSYSELANNFFIDCPTGIQILAGQKHKVTGNFIYNSTNSAFLGIDYRGTNGWVFNNVVSGHAGATVQNSGTGNTFAVFDNQGLGINIAQPSAPFHVYSPVTAGGAVPEVLLQTAGGSVGNGPSIDGYINDPAGSAIALTRIQTSLRNNVIGSMSGDLRFDTTSLGTRLTRFTMGTTGIFESSLGYTIGGLAPSGQYIRGNGVYGVFAALNGSDMTVGTVSPARLGSGVMDATTYLAGDGTWKTYTAGLGGTVTSVALSAPSEFSVSGSPVTTSGTLTFSKANQVTNAIYVGPASGASAAPTFRGIVAADIPNAIIVATTKLTATGTKDATTVLYGDDTWKVPPGAVTNSGTVTSVAMTVPTGFSVSGSPITTSGTLAVTLANATSNTFLAGPTSGAAATPGFRGFVADDIPNAQIIASTKLSATGTKDSSTVLFGDDTWKVPSGGSGTFFADPTGTIGLSQVNGSSTNATRSDGHPALSQAIAPTWSQLHSFINSTTNQIKIGWDVTNVGYVWVDSSGNINFNPTSGEVNVAGVLDARDGFQIGDAAASGHYLRGNGTSYVDSSLNASDLATGTVPTAREGSGTANSTTFLSGDQTWKTAVTSVSLSGPPEFGFSGFPITTTGTLNFYKTNQAANTAYMAPDGASGVPTFRLQTLADLPSGTPFVVSIPNINSGTVGQTTLLTVPTGKRFMTLGIDIEPTTVSGGNNFQQDFFFSLGIGATVDNIWPNRTPSHEFIVGAFKPYGPPGDETQNDTIATAGQLVKLNIPAGGESGVGFEIVFTAHLRGYYR